MFPTVAEALEALLGAIPRPVEREGVPLEEAWGRAAAADLVARVGLPLFTRSAMDGYAVRVEDTAVAAPGKPVLLRLAGVLAAGVWPPKALGEKEAIRILTGAPVPPGADGVVLQEVAEVEGGAIRLSHPVLTGSNIVPAGSEVAPGTVLARKGETVGAAALSLLAAQGQAFLQVRRRVRAAIFSTGDELVIPGKPLGLGQTPDQNGIALTVLCREAGAEADYLGIAPDDPYVLGGFLEAAKGYDVIFSSGGVSVGDRDFLPGVLEEKGACVLFRGVRMRPGKASLGAILGEVPVLALSGNPGAAFLGFHLLGRPLLRKLGGHLNFFRPRTGVGLAEAFPKASPHDRYLRAQVEGSVAHLERGQGAGEVRSLLRANALVVIPGGSGPLAAGDSLEAIWLDRLEDH